MKLNFFKKEEATPEELLQELREFVKEIPILEQERIERKKALIDYHIKNLSGISNAKELQAAQAAALDAEGRVEAAGVIRKSLTDKLILCLERAKKRRLEEINVQVNDIIKIQKPAMEMSCALAQARVQSIQEAINGPMQAPYYQNSEIREAFHREKKKTIQDMGYEGVKSLNAQIIDLNNEAQALQSQSIDDVYIEKLLNFPCQEGDLKEINFVQ